MDLELDPSLKHALEMAEDSKTITPLLKEELKLTILSRRHKSGKGDIDLEEKKPTIKRELSSEEINKKMRRKEQNRRAAERCRIKKKKVQEQLLIDFIEEQKKTQILLGQIEELKQEKEKLQRVVDDHFFVCVRAPTPSPSYDDSTVFFDPTCFPCQTSTGPVCSSQPRYTSTPSLDPFDHQITEASETLMYPSYVDLKPEALPTCTVPAPAEDIPELPQLDLEETLSFLQPCSPDLGRRSISDYNEDFLNN